MRASRLIVLTSAAVFAACASMPSLDIPLTVKGKNLCLSLDPEAQAAVESGQEARVGIALGPCVRPAVAIEAEGSVEETSPWSARDLRIVRMTLPQSAAEVFHGGCTGAGMGLNIPTGTRTCFEGGNLGVRGNAALDRSRPLTDREGRYHGGRPRGGAWPCGMAAELHSLNGEALRQACLAGEAIPGAAPLPVGGSCEPSEVECYDLAYTVERRNAFYRGVFPDSSPFDPTIVARFNCDLWPGLARYLVDLHPATGLPIYLDQGACKPTGEVSYSEARKDERGRSIPAYPAVFGPPKPGSIALEPPLPPPALPPPLSPPPSASCDATAIADSLYQRLTDAARPGRQAMLQAIDSLLVGCRERVDVKSLAAALAPLLPAPACTTPCSTTPPPPPPPPPPTAGTTERRFKGFTSSVGQPTYAETLIFPTGYRATEVSVRYTMRTPPSLSQGRQDLNLFLYVFRSQSPDKSPVFRSNSLAICNRVGNLSIRCGSNVGLPPKAPLIKHQDGFFWSADTEYTVEWRYRPSEGAEARIVGGGSFIVLEHPAPADPGGGLLLGQLTVAFGHNPKATVEAAQELPWPAGFVVRDLVVTVAPAGGAP